MSDGGLTPEQALQATTSNAARALGKEDEIGRIAPGYAADLLVLEGSAVDDISNLRRIRWVF